MLKRTMRHEWRLLATDRTPWIVLALFAIALVYGAANGVRWVNFQESAIAEALDEERQRYVQAEAAVAERERDGRPLAAFGDPRNPDAVGRNFGARYAVMPPTAFAATSIGQSDLLPYYARVTLEPRQTLLALGELENPHGLLAGRFDLAFVIVYLFPLLVIALGYNLVSSEKESGTLALILSQPVRLAGLLVSKIGFRALVLAVILAGFVVVALAAGAMRLTDGASFARLALWVLVVGAYGAFWFTLVIAVTALGRNSATNALALTALWLALVLVVPSTLNLIASVMHPMPSRVEMIQATRMASDDAQAEGSLLLAQYFEDHPELAGSPQDAMDDFVMNRMIVAEEVERRVQPVLDRYEEQLAAQQALVDRFRFLSPAVVTLEALNDIAGTGAARHRHFTSQVADFHEQWRALLHGYIREGVAVLDYGELPAFHYQEERFGAVTGRVALHVIALLLLAGVIGFAGLMRLRRYPLTG